MTLGDMITRLRFGAEIEIRNKYNEKVCEFNSASVAVEPYKDIEVVEWFPNSFNIRGTQFTVFLDIEESENSLWEKRRFEEGGEDHD